MRSVVVFGPEEGAFDGFVPASEELDAALFIHMGTEDAVHGPVVLHIVQTLPVAHGETGEIGRAQHGGLDAPGPDHIAADQVRLELQILPFLSKRMQRELVVP